MVFKITSASGIDIFGLATKNFYGGTWDLGPTWNYLVLAEKPFLVDTGRTGTTQSLLEMIACTGFSIDDLDSVVLSHGHEDHDGGLPEIVSLTGASVKADPVYERLIKLQPDKVPEGIDMDFPPSCWHCIMPESFVDKNCRDYHRNRNGLTIANIFSPDNALGENIQVIALPGHSPDAVGILIDKDIFIAGDNVLPHISPSPSQIESFSLVSVIFPPDQSDIQKAFGLEAYIRSLKTMLRMGEAHPDILSLPGHRLYYYDQWNTFQLADRSREITEHHITRCREIMTVLEDGPKTVKEIVTAHFEPSLLEGMGFYMAKNEIISHLELLIDCGDVQPADVQYASRNGSGHFSSHIQAIEPW